MSKKVEISATDPNPWKYGFYSISPIWYLIFWNFFSQNLIHKKIKKTAIFFFLLDVVPNFIMWKYLYLELSFLLDISNWYLIFWKFFSKYILHKRIKKTAIFFFISDVVPNFIMSKYLYLEFMFLLDIYNWYLIFWKFFS